MNDKQRWNDVLTRNPNADGLFYFGVRTTGIYCHPSCPSRHAKKENVRFYDSPAAARRDGLRPCKRCRPDEPPRPAPLTAILRLCDYLDRHPSDPHRLASLAKRSGLSPFQLHRAFKSFLHVTPKAYLEQVRIGRFKKHLRQSRSVTEAIYETGFESSSAIYGRLDARLGMTPRSYRQGGAGEEISFAFGQTPLGRILIGATDRGVCYLQFGDSDRELLEQLAKEYPKAVITPSLADSSEQLSQWMAALQLHLQNGVPHSSIPLDVRSTVFQKRVWDFLLSIPAGEVFSYREVAEAIGQPGAARAVASACARNRIGVLIPCHRVIRGNGELGGYRWGLARKRALLDAERRSRK